MDEKAWVAVLSPVPQLEAFALPITARTSNAEAHADMIYHTHGIPYHAIGYTSGLMYTHIHKASTVALFFDSDWKVAKFRVVKNKALVNAFHQMSPTLWGFCINSCANRSWTLQNYELFMDLANDNVDCAHVL